MVREDFHMHTNMSDGRHSAEEMVLSAIEKGMTRIGISDHSNACFAPEFGLDDGEKKRAYLAEISRLKEKYSDRIELLCGIEMDYYSQMSHDGYDYMIGSVHGIELPDGSFVEVDDTPDKLIEAADSFFDGDIMRICEIYFDTVGNVIEKTGADIIGHFDLVSKFNRDDRLFDHNDPRYIKAWQKAADRLLLTGKPFEINTGAISRGYQDRPYPDFDMIDYIRARGGRFLLSSDSHHKDWIAYEFDRWEYLLGN